MGGLLSTPTLRACGEELEAQHPAKPLPNGAKELFHLIILHPPGLEKRCDIRERFAMYRQYA